MLTNIFFCILGIIGGWFVSRFYYKKSLRIKKLVYSIDTKVLPNEYYSRFNIDTNREVFYSHISFSNEGNVTIDKDDILEGIEIICLGKIYDIDEASNIKEVALNSLYHVDFKYLEPYDFISLRVIHTDKVDVRVKIKDGYIEKEKD